MKTVALTGLRGAGKSTVFRAVSRTTTTTPGKPSVAMVDVPEPRLERLVELYGSAESTPARVKLVDVPGLDARSLGEARAADTLAVVVRAFGPEVGQERDFAAFQTELAVADLATAEGVAERATRQAKSGAAEARAELEVSRRAAHVLEEGKWLADERWDAESRRILDLWTPLTIKPVLIVLNADEDGLTTQAKLDPHIQIRGLLEAEAAELPPQEAVSLLREFGLDASAVDRFVSAVYDLLGLVTFFTANETEAHSWAVPAGTTAREAAGVVHTDFRERFIRAERISFDDLDVAGSIGGAKSAGLYRVEGKNYVVAEGDILQFRHS